MTHSRLVDCLPLQAPASGLLLLPMLSSNKFGRVLTDSKASIQSFEVVAIVDETDKSAHRLRGRRLPRSLDVGSSIAEVVEVRCLEAEDLVADDGL